REHLSGGAAAALGRRSLAKLGGRGRPPLHRAHRPIFVSAASISSMMRFIFFIVRSSGSDVVMSTPASLRRSIGYFDPPADRKERYFAVAPFLSCPLRT